ncbi:hypothetical protein GCM10027589_06810 [Actinocorallia lasiicapitis]
MLPPGEQTFEAPVEGLNAEDMDIGNIPLSTVEFRDAAGITWRRESDGRIVEIGDEGR